MPGMLRVHTMPSTAARLVLFITIYLQLATA
jgi:hypothetical protein